MVCIKKSIFGCTYVQQCYGFRDTCQNIVNYSILVRSTGHYPVNLVSWCRQPFYALAIFRHFKRGYLVRSSIYANTFSIGPRGPRLQQRMRISNSSYYFIYIITYRSRCHLRCTIRLAHDAVSICLV